MVEKKEETNIFESKLVPKHEVLTDEEKAQILNDLNIGLKQLPRILEDDPIIKKLEAKHGDVIKISRSKDNTYFYYRVVV